MQNMEEGQRLFYEELIFMALNKVLRGELTQKKHFCELDRPPPTPATSPPPEPQPARKRGGNDAGKHGGNAAVKKLK